MFIHYIDALCGKGKTSFVISEAIRMVRDGRRVIICQPTIHLIEETYQKLRDQLQSVKRFHGEVCDDRVIQEISDYFRLDDPCPQVVLMTHEAFDKTPYFRNALRWDLIFDEAPVTLGSPKVRIANVHTFLTQHIEVVGDGKYVRVECKKGHDRALKRIFDNAQGDAAYAEAHDLIGRIRQSGWNVEVLAEDYKNLLANSKDIKEIQFVSTQSTEKLKKFKSVTVGMAYLNDSFFYHVMKRNGCEFVSHPNQPPHLLAGEHENGSFLEVHYLDLPRWSKTIRDGKPHLVSSYVAYIKDLFGSDYFIWLANKDTKDELFDGTNGTRLSGSPYGLNRYRDIDNVAVIAGFNPSSKLRSYLNDMGMSSHDVDKAMHIQNVYQGIMRGSLRVDGSDSLKRVVVCDLRTLEWLQNAFPGSKAIRIPIDVERSVGKNGRPSSGRTRAEIRAGSDKKARIKKVEATTRAKDYVTTLGMVSETYFTSNNRGLIQPKNNLFQHIEISVWNTFTDKAPAGANLTFANVDEFSAWLKECSYHQGKNKEDNQLMLLSNARTRTKLQVSQLHSMILDFDGGHLTTDDLGNIFPELRMVICNTYSSSLEKPRWRAIIFMSRYVTSDAYEAIWDNLMSRLEANGFRKQRKNSPSRAKFHGLDTKKRAANSIFYLPCKAGDAAASFFQDLKGAGRRLLDTDEWLASHDVDLEETRQVQTHPISRPYNFNLGAAGFIDAWRSAPMGVGNELFADLAFALEREGLELDEIEQTLSDEATYARPGSEGHRREQIPRLLDSIREHRSNHERTSRAAAGASLDRINKRQDNNPKTVGSL